MRTPIHALLKTETQAIHAEVEKLSYSDAIMSHTLSPTAYKNLLAVNYAFHSGINNAVHSGLNREQSINDEAQEQLAWTHLQLCHATALQPRIDALSKDLLPLSSSISTTHSQPPQISTLAEAFGAMYVVQGSMLGGSIIHRALQQNPALQSCQPFHFYSQFGAETGPLWKQFCIALATNVTTADDSQQATTKAIETFEFFKAILRGQAKSC